jgi:hypothetical protein
LAPKGEKSGVLKQINKKTNPFINIHKNGK